MSSLPAGEAEDSRLKRYRAELEAAHAEAKEAAHVLAGLSSSCPLEVVRRAARRAQLCAARLYTAASCILSPP